MSLIIGILIILFGYEFDIRFLQGKLKKSQEQIMVTKELSRNKKQIISQSKLTQKDSSMPLPVKPMVQVSGLEMVNILHILEQLIFEARIETYLFEPKTLRDDKWFTIYPVKLSFSGEYKNLLILLNRILQLPYLVVTEELELQLTQETIVGNDRLNVSVLLTFYKNKYERTEGIIKKLSVKDLSFEVSDKNIFKCSGVAGHLYLWANRELRFLGLIKQAQITFGIVSDPMGGIY